MKYILYPIYAIYTFLVITFIYAPIKFLWHLIWHFEIISFQHATSQKDSDGVRHYLYDYDSISECIKDIFIYNYHDKKINI